MLANFSDGKGIISNCEKLTKLQESIAYFCEKRLGESDASKLWEEGDKDRRFARLKAIAKVKDQD